jgi:excisionase family DNA binding protein
MKQSDSTAAPSRRGYPIAEAGELLGGVSRGTVYKLIRAGELKTFTIGRRRFVSDEAIAALIRAREGA